MWGREFKHETIFSLILTVMMAFTLFIFPAYAAEKTAEGTVNSLTPREKAFLAHRGYLLPGKNISSSEIAEVLNELNSRNYNERVPDGYVQVTKIPTRDNEEIYFHPGTGLKAGSIYTQAGYAQIIESPKYFTHHAFKTKKVTDIDEANSLYYLWGEWDDRYGTHQGVDVQYYDGAPVYAVHSGIAVKPSNSSDIGAVVICDGKNSHYYLHMKNHKVSPGDYVSVGQLIGYQSNVGAGGSHLHYEYHAGEKRDDSHFAQPTDGLNTSKPYTAMAYSELR